jgi:hypothetical protein
MAVLTILIVLATQLLGHLALTARPANKHIDTDAEARAVLDRMAVDFAEMVKRPDVDYYFKANAGKYPGHSGGHSKGGGAKGQTDLNDYIAFYTRVTGYSLPTSGAARSLSLVAYRVNGLSGTSAYNKLERRAEGLIWSGVGTFNPNSATSKPIFFLPILIQDMWSAVTDNSTNSTRDQPYLDTIGPNVFRFEYCYLLKNGTATDTPWDTNGGHTSINGLADVEAIGVTIAVVDAQSRALLTTGDPAENNILNLQVYMQDFRTSPGRGVGNKKNVIDCEAQWNQVLTDPVSYPLTATMPRAALSAIRIYTRAFDLKSL